MTTTGQVHVGDIGTHYQAEIQDAGVAFDPTLATSLRLTWLTPTGYFERDATVSSVAWMEDPSDPTRVTRTQWFLNYTVANTDTAFHARPGLYQWQGFVQFPDGTQYHTTIESYIVGGNLHA